MILTYSQLIGKPVVELQNQTRLGKVGDLVINKADFSVPAIVLAQGFFAKNWQIISSMDIIQTVRDGIIVNDANSILELSEAVRVKELVDQGSFGIGQEVYTDSKKELIGKISDYQLDSTCLVITKFIVKNIFSEKIIPVSSVTEIKGRKIYIKDQMSAIKGKHALAEINSQ